MANLISQLMCNWTIGQLDNWAIGQLDNWTIGQLDNWTIGQLDNWTMSMDITCRHGHSKVVFTQTKKLECSEEEEYTMQIL